MNQEMAENQAYQQFVDTMLTRNQDDFCPMRHEKQMDYLFAMLAADFKQKNQQVLDACCGYGRLIHFLQEFDPEQTYVGIDYINTLIEQGQERFAKEPNIRFELGDVMTLSERYEKAFDISINYKTLYCLPYYETLLRQLVHVTRNKIYLTSPFYEGSYEFLTRVHNLNDENDGFSYLNIYSLPKFEAFCREIGVKEVNTVDMALDFDLPRPEDPNVLKTWTENLAEGGRIERTGPIILNWKLVQLVL